MRIRSLLGAGLIGILASCIPAGKHIPLGIGDLVDNEYIEQTEEEKRRREEKIKALEKLVDIQLMQIEALEGHYKYIRSGRESSVDEKIDENKALSFVITHYMRSIGADVPIGEIRGSPWMILDVLTGIFALTQVINQAETEEELPAEKGKRAVKDNFIEVWGEKGVCNGLLLTHNGYFITANHCDSIYIYYKGARYEVEKQFVFNEGKDIKLGKAKIPFKDYVYQEVPSIFLAGSREIQEGRRIVIIGQVDGDTYLQMGRITDSLKDALTIHDSFLTDTYARGGLSGSPVYDDKTGKLVGITLYFLNEYLGGARSDSILDLVRYQREQLIETLHLWYGKVIP